MTTPVGRGLDARLEQEATFLLLLASGDIAADAVAPHHLAIHRDWEVEDLQPIGMAVPVGAPGPILMRPALSGDIEPYLGQLAILGFDELIGVSADQRFLRMPGNSR